MSFKSYVYVFLLGGVLVPTAAVVLAVYCVFNFYSVPYTPSEAARKVSSLLSDAGNETTSHEAKKEKAVSEPLTEEVSGKIAPGKASYPAPKRSIRPLAGWMIVRRNFYGKDPTPSSGGSDVQGGTAEDGGHSSGTATPSSVSGGGVTTAAARYSSMIKDSYLSFARGSNGSEANAAPGAANQSQSSSGMQEKVFAVLKGKVLFLYSNETKSDCLGALDIEAFSVGISKGDDEDDGGNDDNQLGTEKTKMREGELFGKRNAIVLRSVPRLEEEDYESSPSRKRRSKSGISRSNSTRSTKRSMSGMPSLATFAETDGTRPKVTRKSTESATTELRHLSEGEREKVDSNASLPPTITALTKDMDNGTSGLPIPGQSQESADAAAARDKTIMEVELEEKEKRRKEKLARDRRRTKIEGRPWYLFLRSNVKMEEWYHSLLSISTPTVPSSSALEDLGERTRKELEKLTPRPGVDEIFSKDDMKRLLDKLNTNPDQGNIRWLNGLIGRLFLGVCKTAAVEAFIIERAMKKINKTKMPNWIEYIRIDEVDVGNVPPTFTKPMLKELTEDGAYAADIHLNYEGEVRLKVSAAGSFSIRGTNLGRATAQLNVRILSIQGNLRFKINKPPSNRIWWCFSESPQIVMHVEPILASRKMQLNALTRVIEKQIRDGIAEACVMPCYDDIPFFDTSNMRHRGGIFNDFAKQRGAGTVPISTEMTAEGLEAKATPTSTIGTIPEHLRQGGGSITAVPPSVMADALDLPTQHTKGAIRSRADSGQSNAAPDVSGDGAMTSGIAKSLSSGTKKWFAGRNGSGDSPGPSTSAFNPEGEYGAIRSQGPSPSSISNHTASKSGPDSPKPDVDRAPSTSVEGSSDQATYRHAQSTEPPSLSESRPSHPLSQASDNHDDIAQQLGVSSESVSTEQTPGSLIETIRSRAKDKQALQTSVNQAKDAMRKWGNNWAARRNIPLTSSPRTNEESVTSQEDALLDQSTSTSRPSAAHHNQAARSVDIPRSGLTLKERLANATLLATSPPERNIRHSTESERSSWGGYLSQSLDSEEVPVMSRHTASPIIKQPLQHQSTKEAQISRPKIPERPKTMKAISYASASAPQVDAAISNASAPPLPPRLNDMSNDERSSSAPLEQSASCSVTKLPGTAVPDAQDSHTAINPPSLPPRAPAAGHSSDKARGTSMDVAVDSNSSSPVPSPSLPKAEAVLKNVIASSTRGDDIGPL